MEFKVSEELKNKSGIYVILNNINGKYYVGSAINFRDRYGFHLWQLKNSIHKNTILLNSYNKYGKENFSFELLELLMNGDDLIQREQFYIDSFDATNRELGFNISPSAGSNFGLKRTEESKLKVSLTNGRKIYQIDPITNMVIAEYGSLLDAELKTGFKRHVIKSVCMGYKKTYKTYIWKYDENEKPKIRNNRESISKDVIEKRLKTFKPKRILHFSPNGMYISDFESTWHASQATGIKIDSIHNVLTGHRKSVFGQFFTYE